MKVSPLLSVIRNEKWAMDVREYEKVSTLLLSLLGQGVNIEFEERDPIELLSYSEQGRFTPDMLGSGSEGSYWDNVPKGSVAVLPLTGTMLKEGTICAYGTKEIANIMIEAASSKNIVGIVMDGNSGGGAVNSISPIQFAVQKIKAMGKPIIGLVDLSASAHYYMNTFFDHIMASNNISAEIGSIGVMASWQDVQPMYEKMGIKFHTVYAPESEGYKNKPFELAMKGDYSKIKTEMLSPLAQQFQLDVRTNRKGKVNLTVPGILNGKMFYANEALKYGLIDSIGNMDKAIEYVLSNQNK